MAQPTGAHPYMPNSTPAARELMLRALGIDDVDVLFEQIPRDHLHPGPPTLSPGIRSEHELQRRLTRLLRHDTDASQVISFLGGGYWPHHVPAICDEIASRSEFLTPVWGTPSSDLGRNQAWFEFASQLGELVELDFVGLPVYSWGAAIGHALRMATRITGRGEVVLAGPMDPEKLAVIRTYCGPAGMARSIAVREVSFDIATGRVDLNELRSVVSDQTAAVYFENPNFLGTLEAEAAQIAAIARAAGAETIVGTDPLSLGLLAPPPRYGADIVVGTTQPLGVHLNAGGGAGGFIATRDEERYASQYPTLQVSLAGTVRPGERSFGMTLFHQSSYGSRAQANDWTGNSVYLWAVVNAVYMALLGPAGFAEIGRAIASNSAYAAGQVAGVPGACVRWGGFFKEFVVDFNATGRTVAEINAGLRERGIFGGHDLSADFPALGQAALYCVTEIHDGADIAVLTSALKELTA